MEERDKISDPQKTLKQKSAENRKRISFLLPLLCVLVLSLIGGGYWWINRTDMDKTTKYWFDKAAQKGSLAGKNPNDVQSMLDTVVEEGMFNVSVNSSIVFEDGQSSGSLGLENISANHYYCDLRLVLEDSGETIYKSGGLKPGQYIDEIKLSKNLEKGTYPCIAEVTATDPETLKAVGKVDVYVEVMVLN